MPLRVVGGVFWRERHIRFATLLLRLATEGEAEAMHVLIEREGSVTELERTNLHRRVTALAYMAFVAARAEQEALGNRPDSALAVASNLATEHARADLAANRLRVEIEDIRQLRRRLDSE